MISKVKITVTCIKHLRGDFEDDMSCAEETFIGGEHMGEKTGKIGVSLKALVPGVFGDFSNLEIGILVEEENVDLTDGFERATSELMTRVVPHFARLSDTALGKLGVKPVMVPLVKKAKKKEKASK